MSMSTDTDCRKCGKPMKPVSLKPGMGVINQVKFTVTGFRCEYCGHWNDLKRRKRISKPEKAQ